MSTDLDAFRLTNGVAESKPKRQRGRFIRGPIPLVWLQKAAALPGQSPLQLALALRFKSGLERSTDDLRLTAKLLDVFTLKKRTAHDALNRLEAAGLVSVKRPPGQCRVVSIIDNA